MLKQTILKSIVANKFGAYQKALNNVVSLEEITYEIDEAPLTLQILSQAFNLFSINLGDRIVRPKYISFDVARMRASKVSAYINLLLEKLISESEARDFVIAYYGVVATENGMNKKIDRGFLELLCKRFVLVEPVTTALAIYLDKYASKMTKDCWSYLEYLINHGAEPNRVVKYCTHCLASPMGIVGEHGNTRLASYLIGKGYDTHDLMVGGMSISTLLDAGITPVIWPTEVAWDGETDATRFVYSLERDIAHETIFCEFKFLLASGLDLNSANGAGDLPLGNLTYMARSLARRLSETTIFQLYKTMIGHGADVNAYADRRNTKTSLMVSLSRYIGPHDKNVAEYRFLVNLISTLLDLGASATMQNAQGLTALHYAAESHPSLMPLLREHVDRTPYGLTEVLLFHGPQRCLSLLEASTEIDEASLQQVFQYAVMLRHEELVDHLSSRRFDVVAALEPLRGKQQKNGLESTYDIEFLKFMNKRRSQSLVPFWRDLLIRDYRFGATKIAQDWFSASLGEAAAQIIMAECHEIKVAGQKLIRRQTRVFVSRLRALFTSLRQYKIFAVDINGSGWAPGDHGWEVAYEMISPKDLSEFGAADESDMSICWTDIGYYKNEARGFNTKGRMQEAVTAAYIYYTAPNHVKRMEMASRIIEVAIANGFQADWDGDTERAVLLRESVI